MPEFEFEITKRIELVRYVRVSARDSDAAQVKVDKLIADGFADNITVSYPIEWDIAVDEVDTQER